MEQKLDRRSTLPLDPPSSWSIQLIEQKFARRSTLPLKKDSLWQIKSGVVRTLTWLADGTTVTLGIWGPGDMVGKILSTADPYHMECLTPVEVTLLPVEVWQTMTDAMISHIQRTGEIVEILHCRSVDVALLRLLKWLAGRFGSVVDKGQRINLRLTHQEIADAIGTSRVTVTRLLKNFEQQGIIERFPQQCIVLQDIDPLWHYEI